MEASVRVALVARGVLLAVALGSVASRVQGQTYNWLTWTLPDQNTASASHPDVGTVRVVTSLPNTFVTIHTKSFLIGFQDVPFTPVVAPWAEATNAGAQMWGFTIDFTSVPETGGLFVGIGNFGHGLPTLPGYRLDAFDAGGEPMALGLLEEIGSYNHVWTGSGAAFNDDVTLNTATGAFEVTMVPGVNENNSDMLLFELPSGVGRLVITSVGGTTPDTIGVVVSPAAPPPECAGDANGDGATNGADLSVLLGQFGSAVAAGTGADFNGDGFVNGADLSVLLSNFGCA